MLVLFVFLTLCIPSSCMLPCAFASIMFMIACLLVMFVLLLLFASCIRLHMIVVLVFFYLFMCITTPSSCPWSFLFYLLLNFNLVSPKFLSHPNFSFSLSFNYFSSDIFCSRLMLTIFLYSLHHAKTTSSSFQVFWKCFGWAKDLFKLELFSNLCELRSHKNYQSILFKFYIIPDVQGYFVLSLILLKNSLTFSFSKPGDSKFQKRRKWKGPPSSAPWASQLQPTQPSAPNGHLLRFPSVSLASDTERSRRRAVSSRTSRPARPAPL